jgi:hypothetical protein
MKLTEAVVRGLPFAERRSKLHWDSEVTGFGVRCTVGAKAFILNTSDRRCAASDHDRLLS